MDSNELKHYGVLGMKWGVRKDRVTSSRPKKQKLSKDEKKARRKEVKRKYAAGRKRVESMLDTDTRVIIRDGAAVAAGALWIASALVPGNVSSILNGAAAVTNMVSIIADTD